MRSSQDCVGADASSAPLAHFYSLRTAGLPRIAQTVKTPIPSNFAQLHESRQKK
jgi:hypothetical protein